MTATRPPAPARVAPVEYELAFERYLRERRIPCIRVNQTKRTLAAGGPVKSADFLVRGDDGTSFIVDVKGKSFPLVHAGGRTYWESWVHGEDLSALAQWEKLLGADFRALLVFVYRVADLRDPHVDGLLFNCLQDLRGSTYALTAVRLDSYRRLARPRSASWDAVDCPASAFRDALRPVDSFFGATRSFPHVDPSR